MKEYAIIKQTFNKDSLPHNLYQKAKRAGIWNPVDSDFSQDREDWKKLTLEQQTEFLRKFALCIREKEAITVNILPMIMAVSKKGWIEEEMYLTTFLLEEAKHTEFFSLFLENIGVIEDFSHLMTPEYKELFNEILPSTIVRLRVNQSSEELVDVAVLYNIFVEGVLAETGYWFFYEAFSKVNLFPGFIEGIRNVKRDKGRHIGFGTFLIQRLVSEQPELFERVQLRLRELRPHVQKLTERLDGEKVSALGIEKGKSMEYALKQLTARIEVLSRAIGKSLDEIYCTETA